MSEEVHFKDFTKKRKPVRFKIDDDIFECVPVLGIDDLQEIVRVFRGVQTDDDAEGSDADKTIAIIGKIREAFRLFLQAESYEVFMYRLGDRTNPIDPEQLLEIVGWIVETFTKRPTVPSSNSSNGSQIDDGGTHLTAGVLQSALSPSSLT